MMVELAQHLKVLKLLSLAYLEITCSAPVPCNVPVPHWLAQRWRQVQNDALV